MRQWLDGQMKRLARAWNVLRERAAAWLRNHKPVAEAAGMSAAGVLAARMWMACTGAKAVGIVGVGGFGTGAAVAVVAPLLGLIIGLAVFGIYMLQKGWEPPQDSPVYAI